MAIVAGIVVALIGFAPYVITIRRSRHMLASENGKRVGLLLLTFFLSLIILAAGLIICAKMFKPVAIPFAAAEVLAFIIVVIAYGLISRGGSK